MNLSAKRLKKLRSTGYRQAFLREMVTSWVVHQIKTLRKERGWTQEKLAEMSGNKPQSTIGRIESDAYGKWTASTLLDLANAFNVALEIKFVSWPDFLRDTEDTSPIAMSVPSFSVSQFSSDVPYNLIESDLSQEKTFAQRGGTARKPSLYEESAHSRNDNLPVAHQ